MTDVQPFRPRELALTVGAPALIGVLIAMGFGLEAIVASAAQLPLVLIGVALIMTPALYICASLSGQRLTTRRMVDAARTYLVRSSLVLLGLAPALLFLNVSAQDHSVIQLTAPFALRIAMFIGAVTMLPIVFGENAGAKGKLLFIAWALVGLGIAESLYSNVFEGCCQ